MNATADLERPLAWLPLALRGIYRATPNDFVVEERLAYEPTGSGAHLLLFVEKRLANTETVAHDLARAFAVERVAVSFAGRKDRRAIARQWFSVETPRHDAPLQQPGWRVLRVTRHDRKLRRGELAGNAFSIRLTALDGDVAALDARLALLGQRGFPNYFGAQRFGRDGANVGRASAWLAQRRKRRVSAFEKGLHLSVGRALLFNAVLAERVRGGTWQTLVSGDVALDGSPTGPLWGRGRSQAAACAAAIESRALESFVELRDALEHVGLGQDRRALVARPRGLRWAFASDGAVLDFELAPGCYATQLLAELGCLTAASTGARAA